MNYKLLHEIIDLFEEFEKQSDCSAPSTVGDFKKWIGYNYTIEKDSKELDWEGKAKGRSPESVINTLLVNLNRYAKTYSKSVIYGSEFSTQEEFIYLINLKAFGSMTKMELIKKNIHEKSAGMLIISRLINQGWVKQADSDSDKRSKMISITEKGNLVLEKQMDKIRKASKIVTGNLTPVEKLELIRLLTKLEHFHLPIFSQNFSQQVLLDEAFKYYSVNQNQKK